MTKSFPTTWSEHDQKVRHYFWCHRVLSISSKILSLLLFISFLIHYRFQRMEAYWMELDFPPFFIWLLFFGVLAGTWEAVLFPFSISHHYIERAFGLSKQSYLGWFKDRLKGYGVGAVLGSLALFLVFLSVQWGGKMWWVFTAIGFVLLSVVLAQVAPILLIPLFFKLKPMESSELKNRLLALSQKFGVAVSDVFHLGMGEKTEKGNAAFVGIGKTKRILLGDTLYEKFPADEVEAVFAHELGHQVHGDLVKGISFSAVLMFLGFFMTELVVEEWIYPTFKTSREFAFGMLLFFVCFSIIQIPLGFLQTLFSRQRERAADDFARVNLKSGEALASALERLTFQNWGLFKPNVLLEFFTFSHPAPWRRITSLRDKIQ